MDEPRRSKELQSVEDFKEALEAEISVSAEFDLPLTLLLAAMDGEWDHESALRVLDILRVADLVSQLEPSHLAIALPNTIQADARSVEARVRLAVPSAAVGAAEYRKGDSVPDLIERARRMASRPGTL